MFLTIKLEIKLSLQPEIKNNEEVSKVLLMKKNFFKIYTIHPNKENIFG